MADRSQVRVWVVLFLYQKHIPLTALTKQWNNYMFLYKPQERLRASYVFSFSLLLSLPQHMTQAKQQLSWHFTYLSTHFLCQKGICHTCRQQKTKPSHLPVSCSVPGEMCEHGQMFELCELMRKRNFKKCFFQMPGIAWNALTITML